MVIVLEFVYWVSMVDLWVCCVFCKEVVLVCVFVCDVVVLDGMHIVCLCVEVVNVLLYVDFVWFVLVAVYVDVDMYVYVDVVIVMMKVTYRYTR